MTTRLQAASQMISANGDESLSSSQVPESANANTTTKPSKRIAFANMLETSHDPSHTSSGAPTGSLCKSARGRHESQRLDESISKDAEPLEHTRSQRNRKIFNKFNVLNEPLEFPYNGMPTAAFAGSLSQCTERPDVASIIPPPDIERLLSAMRAESIHPGGREVVVALSDSNLGALRIIIRLDSSGYLNAEFITSSEKAKAELRLGIADLAHVLRSKGIKLGKLMTSCDSDTAGQRDRNDAQFVTQTRRLSQLEPIHDPASTLESQEAFEGGSDILSSKVYRA